jgi:hypothetical protein
VILIGLTVVDLLDPTRRGRVNAISGDGTVVSVMWAPGDVPSVNVTDPSFVVEVPLREAARQRRKQRHLTAPKVLVVGVRPPRGRQVRRRGTGAPSSR